MNIDPGRDVPLFVQIVVEKKDDVFTGMNILVDEGIIYKRRGMGMYVQDGAREKVRAKRESAFDERYVSALVAEAKKLGLTKEQVIDLIEKGYDHA